MTLFIFLVLLASFVALSIFVERGDGSLAAALTVFLFVVAFFYYEIPLSSITNNFPYIFVGLIVYLTLGAVWSVIRWMIHLKRWKNEYEETLEKSFILAKNKFDKKPQASKSKDRILGWIAFWWISIINWLLFDLLHDAVTYIYKKLVGVYDWATSYVLGDIEDPTEKAEDEQATRLGKMKSVAGRKAEVKFGLNGDK